MNRNSQRSRPNIYLIGFMGVGKSAVGRALARSLQMNFIDSDHVIEQRAGKSVSEIFADEGEPAFRQLEREFVENGHQESGAVVSCGGGVPMQPGMHELRSQKGVVICLFARPETIIRRTVGNPKRPLLNVENPEQRVRELMQQREPVYMDTGIGISTESRTIPEVVKNIIRVYRRECKARRK